ncbi:aminoacyl tRNA synthase complex-interacting multifunctional protein 1-like [Poecilia formosa]|uniref:aminoacyl tRNA synthase complex-interacting multifunctional protein 1-like n=1 Tax=Poecilia formosa TaxID=48698 RepID=UPI0004444E2C|nr:PREDICTED: aminoacyl tRNA synthase complex-interacting multifunctional protein 1-like [Poecilia formosa]
MDNMDNLFNPSLAEALKKLDPDDGEQIMEYFKTHALLSREKALLQASVREQKKLLVENAKLKKDIDQLRGQLQDKQKRRTAKALFSQAPPPQSVSPAHSNPDPASPAGATAAVPPNCPPPSVSSGESRDRPGRRRRGEKKARPVSDPLSLGAESRIDASRLDLRVGRILSVRRHPLAEAMSVQEVDVGENAPRTVVSKLGGLQDLDQVNAKKPRKQHYYIRCSERKLTLLCHYFSLIFQIMKLKVFITKCDFFSNPFQYAFKYFCV